MKLEEEVRLAKRRENDLVLLFMDMDHFKEVNDKFGHLTGSHVLQNVGNILTEVVSSSGVTIARYGGDEFVIIFSQLSLEEVYEVANLICAAIKKHTFKSVPVHPKERSLMIEGRLTCSIGLASFRTHVDTNSSSNNIRHFLIRMADEAMYRAKSTGKGCVCIAEPSSIRS